MIPPRTAPATSPPPGTAGRIGSGDRPAAAVPRAELAGGAVVGLVGQLRRLLRGPCRALGVGRPGELRASVRRASASAARVRAVRPTPCRLVVMKSIARSTWACAVAMALVASWARRWRWASASRSPARMASAAWFAAVACASAASGSRGRAAASRRAASSPRWAASRAMAGGPAGGLATEVDVGPPAGAGVVAVGAAGGTGRAPEIASPAAETSAVAAASSAGRRAAASSSCCARRSTPSTSRVAWATPSCAWRSATTASWGFVPAMSRPRAASAAAEAIALSASVRLPDTEPVADAA